jgi:glycosyltransferase involved in cell wall biosynthesis
MYFMAKQLQQNNIKFNWIVYGDNSAFPSELERCRVQFREFESIHFVGRVNDVRCGLVNADYLVQLSDFEGCPYSVLEALAFNIPCILTDYKGSEEIVQHGVNGYRLPLDMNISDWSFIYDIPKFTNEPLGNIQQWIELGSSLLNTKKTK